MRSLVARLPPDVADHLALEDPLTLRHARVVQVAVEGVVAAAVVEQDRCEVGAERSGEAHGAGRDRPDRRAHRRRDADAVPRDAGVVRARGGPELVEDAPVHRPVELSEIGRGDGGRTGGDAAGLRFAPGALERRHAVVQGLLVSLELRQPLLRLARVAPGFAQRRLPFVFQLEIAVELLGALALAPSQRVPTDRKSTRLNSSHGYISYAVFCLKKKKNVIDHLYQQNACSQSSFTKLSPQYWIRRRASLAAQ